MIRTRPSAEPIVAKLHQVDTELAGGK